MLFGILPILITPFSESGSIDVDSLHSLLKYYNDSGVDGITCLGEVSEAPFLSEEEKKIVRDASVEHFRGKTVVSGVWGNSLDEVVKACITAQDSGVHALLIPPPPNAGSEEIILKYFLHIDKKVDLPVVILDHPVTGRKGLSPELISRICSSTEKCRFLKIEDPPTALKMERIKEAGSSGITILGASHGRYFYWELLEGARGLMTSTPIPDVHIKIWNSFISGRKEEAFQLFLKTLPLSYFMESATVEVKKEIFLMNGIIRSSFLRSSDRVMTPVIKEQLEQLLKWTESETRRKN